MKAILAGLTLLVPVTSVLAQSTVEVYGRLDISMNQLRYGSTATKPSTTLNTVSSDVSMIGFRGREDLGGGLRAYFKIEHGLQLDTGALTTATQFWNRESFVGLGHSGYGSVQLGSMYSFNVYASVKVDPFARFTSASMLYLLQGLGGTRGFPSITNNVVAYLTPNLSGVSGRFFVSAPEGATTGRSYASIVEYDKGPVYAMMSFDRLGLQASAVGLIGVPVRSNVWNAAATYDFKVVKVHGWYQNDHTDRSPANHGYMAGISAPIGLGAVRASYTHKSAPNAAATLMGVGYDYNFSKRTLVYTALAKVNNSGTAAFPIGPSSAEQRSAALPAAGRDARSIQLGVRHFF